MVYKCFDKTFFARHSQSNNLAWNKIAGSGVKNEKMSNQQFAEELHQPIIRKFGKRKVYSPFKDNIWGADLADMQ